MKHCLLTILAALLASRALCQPSSKPALSLDYLALSSNRVVVGKVNAYSGMDGWDKKRTVTLEIQENLKGTSDKSVTLDAGSYSIEKLKAWQTKGERLLVFAPQARAGIIDLEAPSVMAGKFDHSLLHGGRQILSYVKSVLSRNPGVTNKESIDLMAPDGRGAADWNKTYPGSWGLLVPVDSDVDNWLGEMLQSKDDKKIIYALSAIPSFKSDRNIALIKRQLMNTELEMSNPAEYNCGFDSWMYGVRGYAYEDLHDRWHVDVPKPALRKEVSRLITVKEIHLPNRYPVDRLKLLEACPHLTSIDCRRYAPNTYRLGQEQVNAAQIAEIGRLKHLTSIEIAGSESLDDNSLKTLSGLKNLQELNIDQTRLTDASIPTLAAFPNLKTLHIDLTEITDSGLANFKQLRPDVRLVPPVINSIIDHYADDNEIDDVRRVVETNPTALEARDGGGNTPLIIACRQGFDDMARMLIEHGAKVNSLTNNNTSALEFAAVRDDVSLCELLLHKGAEINHADSHGDTPLHMAAITCRADIISFFLKHGADPYARNADGWTPKEETSSRGAKDMTALIDDFEKRKRATE